MVKFIDFSEKMAVAIFEGYFVVNILVLFWYDQLKKYSDILHLQGINISQEEILLFFIPYVWLPVASTKTGLEANADKTKYMAISRS